ncbi:MAG TPA: DMT family transporter, partial [Thermohalobaculum sp.]|nr:DMT family transporter [Thermohalobaculum sp.]
LGLHLLRNVLHFIGQNLWFLAVGLIPLAQVFALEFTTPIWVALLAPLVLGEAMTRARATAAFAGFVGILLVARPGVTPVEVGHAAAALAAVFFAGSFLTTKMLSRNVTTFIILFWMTGMQSVFGLATAGFDGDVVWPAGDAALWVSVAGVCGLTAHLCITSALQRAPASVVAPMDFARLPLIAVVGMVLYGEPLEVAVFAGGLVILAGNMLNIRAERRRVRGGAA